MNLRDRINPIVIKELRQGLKSRSFIATFIGLQGVMVLSMFIYLAAVAADQSDLGFAHGFFWVMLGLMLLLFMPLRAFQALYDEIRHNTLEMLFLTRMTSWDIAFGKWLALLLQILLLVAAVLPYLVMRYFLGSIAVSTNLMVMGLQVVLSMLLVSAGVGLSAIQSRIIRGLLVLGALFATWIGVAALLEFSQAMGRSGLSGGPGGWDVLYVLTSAGLMMVFMVEYGASRIAPPAENHARRKRGLSMAFTALSMLYAFVILEDPEFLILLLCLLVPVFVDALCEPLVGISSIYRKGWQPPVLRWLFYPGWASAYFFVTVMLVLIFSGWVILEEIEYSDGLEAAKLGLLTYNTLILPFVFVRLIPALSRRALPAYLTIQVICLLSCLMMVFLEDINLYGEDELNLIGHFLPMLGIFRAMDGDLDELWPFLLFIVSIGTTVLAVLAVRRPVRQILILRNRES